MDDLRHAVRALWKQRGFTAVAVLTLALGIGVNASLFSIVSAFFLQPLAVKDAHRLVLVMQRSDALNMPYGHSYPDYLDYRASVASISDLAAYMPTPVHVSTPGQAPERTWIEVVSPNYFTLAGVFPAAGRFPDAQAERRGTAPTVVLSYRYWQRRFGGDPSLVGRPILLNGKTFTVIGVAPETFTGLAWAMAVSAFVPSGALGTLMEDGDRTRDNRGAPLWRLMGRLGPGRTVDTARAEIEVTAARLAAAYPAEHKGSRVLVIPENRARPDPAIAGFLPIFAAIFVAMVALVLFIACANVANLMLARAVARQRDLVIRSALGASRFRLVRLQIVESLVLAIAAGVVGFLFAYWAGRLLSGMMPAGDIPINEHRGGDWRVYVFTFAVSVVAGIATGLWPARTATRFDLAGALKDGSGASISRHRLRDLLVIGQVTMSLVVLVSAGLFLHSLRRMQGLSLGFEPRGVVMMSIDLGLQQYGDERGARFLDDLVTRAEALPGIQAASVTTHVPFDYSMRFRDVTIDGGVPGAKDGFVSTAFAEVGARFFETLEAPLLRGRPFSAHDDDRAPRVAIVNETMARRLWPARDAIGQRFRTGRDGEWLEVAGIVRDGRYVMLGEGSRPYFYVPIAQHYRSPVTIVARSASDPAAAGAALRRLVNDLDPNLPVFNVRSMEQHIGTSVFGSMPLRIGASMAGVQGLIGLFLAVMGLYAVVSHGVTRRKREIAIRMALGAERTDVLRLVVKRAMRLSLIGIAIGLAVAAALGAVLSFVLYGIAPVNPGVLGGVTAVLIAVSALACYLPARRATRVDPLVALRYE
jgi:putative ABC transport system permease protein